MASLPDTHSSACSPCSFLPGALALCYHLLTGDFAQRQPRPRPLEPRAQDAGVLTASLRKPPPSALPGVPPEAAPHSHKSCPLPMCSEHQEAARKENSQDATDAGSPEAFEKGLFLLLSIIAAATVPAGGAESRDGYLHDNNKMAGFLKSPESPQRAEKELECHPPPWLPSARAARHLIRRRGPLWKDPGGSFSFHQAQTHSAWRPVILCFRPRASDIRPSPAAVRESARAPHSILPTQEASWWPRPQANVGSL